MKLVSSKEEPEHFIDFAEAMLDVYDELPIKNQDKRTIEHPDGVPLTLGTCCVKALSIGAVHDEGSKGQDKADWWALAHKIAAGEKSGLPVKLAEKEIATIKDRIGKIFLSPEVVGRAWFMLDGVKEAEDGAA